MKLKRLILVFSILVTSLSALAKETQHKVSTIKKLTFMAETNVPGVEIVGDLKNAQSIKFSDEQKVIIPIDNLKTGMDKRDEHMKDKIFSFKNVEIIGGVYCSEKKKCYFKGALNINNKNKNVSIPLTRVSNGFKLVHKILLKDFNIERPGFIGVKVEDEVKLEVLFN